MAIVEELLVSLQSPKKNPILIYDLLFRPLLLSIGLWDQVRIDHRTEFAIIATAQQHLSTYRQNQYRWPILQSLSRQNHCAERIWPEINQRINYPIKCILIDMENNDDINMGDEMTKFCVSWVTIKVMESAIRYFIPGSQGGVPNILSLHSHVTTLPPHFIVVTSTLNFINRADYYSAWVRWAPLNWECPLWLWSTTQPFRATGIAWKGFLGIISWDEPFFENILRSDGVLFKTCITHFLHITNSFFHLLDWEQ